MAASRSTTTPSSAPSGPRRSSLFAGSDGRAEHWAIPASLIETCKLNGVDPQSDLTDVIARTVHGHPDRRLDELLPWNLARGPARLVP